MANRPKKPTGTNGPFEVTVGASAATVQWQTAQFPTGTEQIEAGIVGGFLKDADRQDLLPFSVTAAHQNPQDDLDFTLETSSGRRYLELTEIAHFEKGEGFHSKVNGAYKPYDLASAIVANFLKKSARYTAITADAPILLLIYNTHWAFNLGDTALMLLQYFSQASRHCFERIYYFRPLSERLGTAYDVFPTPPEHWAGFDPEVCRDDVAYNLVPGAIEMRPEGGAIMSLTPRSTRTRAKNPRR